MGERLIKVFNELFYQKVQRSRMGFFIFILVILLFHTGITFTFVIPGLKGFTWSQLLLALLMYFICANIFVGLYTKRAWLVFIITLLLGYLGMGWRIWLEWGEYTLAEYLHQAILIFYPMVIALLITGTYSIIDFSRNRKNDGIDS
ncbi:ABC transporter permease [Lysinibacillus sp. 54212]|uniref:ABC transporter permease n=1 Tax=Lysinibacillus sp. 54212 TaxID=3119829 RepID=UPI002FCA629D